MQSRVGLNGLGLQADHAIDASRRARSFPGQRPARTSIEGTIFRGHSSTEWNRSESVAAEVWVVHFTVLDVDAERWPDQQLT